MNEHTFCIRTPSVDFVTSTAIPVTLLNIKDVLIHEDHDPIIAGDLARKMQAEAYFTTPVLVDDKNLILLDGHHRYHVLSAYFHAQSIPCVLIDYTDESLVSVSSWRPEMIVDRRVVQEAALNRNPLPMKTSRHTVSFELGELSIPLSQLGNEA
jgi:hypothetical protein